MGIRGRLLLLAVGVAVPLALVGLADLREVWRVSQSQLDDSVKQQAELAAVAFERWVDAQRQPLTTIAAISAEQEFRTPEFNNTLHYIVATRPHWIDLRIVNQAGETLVAQPAEKEPPPPALINFLLSETRRRASWTIVTDRTLNETQTVFAIAVPIEGGGAVIARLDGATISELFHDIQLSDRSVIAVFDSDSRVLYRRETTPAVAAAEASGSPLFAALGARRVAVVEVESPYDGIRRIYGLARAGVTGCVVAVGVPSAILYRPAHRQLMLYLFFSLLALGCAIVVVHLIERGIVRPMELLRRAAQALGAGDLSARAPIGGSREIREVGAAFNQMAEQIEEREERLAELDRLKSEFVSSVSHELRTPLTTIKTLTHVLQRGDESEAERREYLEAIATECDRQIDLVLNLLDLSRIESGAYKVSRTWVNPAEVVEACIMSERHTAEARAQNLEADLPVGLPHILTDRRALRRVLRSLIENAIKYTPRGGQIKVGARLTGSEVAIMVSDTGCGISLDDIPFIFEKFYRGRRSSWNDTAAEGSSPYAETPGIGLGLYLARNIVEQLEGRITVESEIGHGATFTVFLPVGRAEDDETSTVEEHHNAETVTRS